MTDVISIDREWIAREMADAFDHERSLSNDASGRAASPPDANYSVLYHEIALSDERHATILETIATRYGHTPRDFTEGGVGRILEHIKAQVEEFGSSPLEQVWADVAAKSRWIHWLAAWAHTFETLGDLDSARDIASVMIEEQVHRDALQNNLNRLMESRAADRDERDSNPSGQ